MKNIDGFDYSRKRFDNYKLRLIIEITDRNKEMYRLDIYTTQTSLDAAWDDLLGIVSDKVGSFRIIHNATKEQDDLASKIIEEFLNEN